MTSLPVTRNVILCNEISRVFLPVEKPALAPVLHGDVEGADELHLDKLI